jgi:hypothetical protein
VQVSEQDQREHVFQEGPDLEEPIIQIQQQQSLQMQKVEVALVQTVY